MTNNLLNRFITVEGIDGSGKTTVINYIKEFLINMGYDVILTQEPYGQKIRQLLLNKNNLSLFEVAKLFATNRIDHLNELILKNLNKNKFVICDRFVDSSVAYQAFAQNLDLKTAYDLNEYAYNNLPFLTFYLCVDIQIAKNRILNNRNNNEINEFDKQKDIFYQRVIDGYEYIYKNDNLNRIVKINANQNLDNVKKEIEKILKERIK